MASKNILSDGYIQFPDLTSEPVSCSLFASFGDEGFGVVVGIDGSARGIELISRSKANGRVFVILGS